MKMNKFFMLACAAMAFAACSNEDDPSSGDGGTNGNGEIINTISIAFVNGGSGSNVRAAGDDGSGVGTENSIYHAFVFAKEAEPQHANPTEGDWTVKEVGTLGSTTALVSGNEGTTGTLGNMCSFNNVRQGDNVYVIANDPNMTLGIAEGIAHQSTKSEEAIKAYVSKLSKAYINGLTIKVGDETVNNKKQFIMAGVAAIPTSQVANGSVVTVPITLDRELAKVRFSASVTSNPTDEAYGKVQIMDGTVTLAGAGKASPADGIIVVRIPRQVSFFTTHDRDWYCPASPTQLEKDWGADWVAAFHGETESALGTAAAAAGLEFNNKVYQSDATDRAREYRLTWQVTAGDYEAQKKNLLVLSRNEASKGVMESPIFYTTPNYSDNAGCATVVCTQATYTGPDLLINKLNENKAYQALAAQLFETIQAGGTNLKDAASSKAAKLDNVVWNDANIEILLNYLAVTPANDAAIKAALATVYNITPGTADDDSKVADLLTKLRDNLAVDNKDEDARSAIVDYRKGDKLYYRADVAKYVGSTSMKNTERNTYYVMRGNITSLGAKTIDQAITSTEIGMVVQVIVNKWTLVLSDIDM